MRHFRLTRWAAATVAITTLFGTGGIAVAGGLPRPIQSVVADMARALPLPIDVPYPAAVDRLVVNGDAAARDRNPEDAEVEIDSYQPAPDAPVAPSVPPVDGEVVPASSGDRDLDQPPARVREGDRCDLSEIEKDRGRLDRDEIKELRIELRLLCGLELFDPPRWAHDGRSSDPGQDDADEVQTSHQDQDRDRDRGDRDRDRDRARDRSGDPDSSDSERSGETKERTDDKVEERPDDGSTDRSSAGGWRDRHD
ncbi:MAG TPA: hypothetical protein VMS99_02325 [Acidimicrobiia bacterium]|nr:hypothetical protein [Acidimicrobiia bacterium]